MIQIPPNDFPAMSFLAEDAAENQYQNLVNRITGYNLRLHNPNVMNSLYVAILSLLMLIGCAINYKLFDNVRKENHGESGKVLQWIMKTYALIQAITWPGLFVVWIIIFETVEAYGDLLNPCLVIYSIHLLIFSFLLLRIYVGLNSLVLAVGRYIYVVHHLRIFTFGIRKIGNILIWSNFVIPLVVAILISAVMRFNYNGWMAEFQMYDHACYLPDIEDLRSNSSGGFYRLPIYDLANLYLPSSVTDGMYVVAILTAFILCSNVTEAVIYVKCILFVIK